MKLICSFITLSVLMSGCSDKPETRQEIAPLIAATHNKTTHSANKKYQQPTFIGSNIQEQRTLLAAFKQKKDLSDKENKQQLLIELAVFASDNKQSLDQLEKLTKTLEHTLANDPTDFEIMAALGSSLSLQSIFHQDDLGKMNFLARKGMRLMDRAVKKSPNHLGARLLRGLSYANMPEFLNRASFAVTDLNLLKQYVSDDKEFKQLINYHLAMAYSKNNQIKQAHTLWQQVAQIKNTTWTTKAQARLKETD